VSGEADRRLLIRIARAADLGEGAEGVRAIVRAAWLEPGRGVRAIGAEVRIALPAVSAVCGELRKAGLVGPKGQGVRLTDQGERYARETLGFAARGHPGSALDEALGLFEPWCAERPEADLSLDQSKGLPESVLRRALHAYADDGVEGRAVCLLGDDDLSAIAIAIAHRVLSPSAWTLRRLTVIDTDPRVLALVRKGAEALDVPIETVEADLATGFPPELARAFDVILTDPPYTVPGALLFLSRAAALLEPGPGHRCYLSFGHKPPGETLELISAVCDCGLAPVEILPAFNRYEGAGILGGTSQLLSLRTTRATRPVIEGCYAGPLYTADV
jgi:predicted methyltransferase